MIKKISKNIASRYCRNSSLLVIQIVMYLMVFTWYRIEIFILVKSIYADLKNLNFFDYAALSIYYDLVILLFLSIPLCIIMLLADRLGKVTFIVMYIMAMIIFIALLTGVEFFRVYETTFRKGFIGSENSEYWLNMTASYFAEASRGFYIKLFISGMIIFPLIMYAAYAFDRRLARIKNILHVPAMAIVIFALIIFTLNPKNIYASMSGKFPELNVKKINKILYDISLNPLYSILIQSEYNRNAATGEGGKTEKVSGIHNPDAAFQYRLDTDSLISKKVYPRFNNFPRGEKYNIIFYFFESLHSRYMNKVINGKNITATWDRLSKNSLNMKNHYANFPLSANALYSVFTSAYDPVFTSPFDINLIVQNHPGIRLRTIPEILKDAGYRTCLIHTWDLSYVGQRKFLSTRKFDRIIEDRDLTARPPYNKRVGLGIDDRAMIEPAVEFMKENSGTPFFMTFLPLNPHSPYHIPDSSFRISGPIGEDTPYKEKRWLDYVNSVYFSDQVLGMLIDRLEKENLLDRTVIFIFADHGQAFYQHNQNYLHRHFLYEENVHVPFLIYNKKIFKQPADFEGITRHIDILPTLLDMLSLPSTPTMEGESIISSRREKLALLHTYWDEDYNSIRDGRWKYIIRMKDRYEELFDLSIDPWEKNNLAGVETGKVLVYRNFLLQSQSYKVKYYETVLKH